jgi:hypothetical protein
VEEKMKRYRKRISLLLSFTVLVISTTSLIQANATDSNTDDVEFWQKTPLTNGQIKEKWPNLPTAKQIREDDFCFCIDLRYCGKQASSMSDDLPDPDSPTIIDIQATIVNCTMNVPDFLHGGIIYNLPHIWLQYDKYIWIQVPLKYLTN